MEDRNRVMALAAPLLLFALGLYEGLQSGEHGVALFGFALAYPLVGAVLGGVLFIWRRAWWPRIPIVMLSLFVILVVGVLMDAAGAASPQEERRLDALTDTTGTYVTVRLANLEFQLPSNWTRLDDNARTTIHAGTIGRLAEAGVLEASGEYTFAANLYDRGRTLALMNVRHYPDMDITQEEVRALSRPEIEAAADAFRDMLEKSLFGEITYLAWHDPERVQINGLTALIFGYDRTSVRDTSAVFRARMVRVLDGRESFTLTISYDRDVEFLLRPSVDFVIRSLRRPEG